MKTLAEVRSLLQHRVLVDIKNATGLAHNTIADIRDGKRVPGAITLEKISNYLESLESRPNTKDL